LCGESELSDRDKGCVVGKLFMSVCGELKNGSWEENGELPNICPSGKGIDEDAEKSPLEGYIKGNMACVAEG
jgi:hypothetical protein